MTKFASACLKTRRHDANLPHRQQLGTYIAGHACDLMPRAPEGVVLANAGLGLLLWG